jgi:hypothetical protein
LVGGSRCRVLCTVSGIGARHTLCSTTTFQYAPCPDWLHNLPFMRGAWRIAASMLCAKGLMFQTMATDTLCSTTTFQYAPCPHWLHNLPFIRGAWRIAVNMLCAKGFKFQTMTGLSCTFVEQGRTEVHRLSLALARTKASTGHWHIDRDHFRVGKVQNWKFVLKVICSSTVCTSIRITLGKMGL